MIVRAALLQLKALASQHGSRWAAVPAVLDTLKARARELKLWNVFMPPGKPGSQGVSMQDYAALSEVRQT
jgi:hypothetical protein